MLTKLMGAAVFSIGFLMLVLAVLDLLNIGGLNFDTGKRFIVYGGGVLLCLIGYYMARRLPVVEAPPEEVVQTTTEIQREGPPQEHF